MEQRLANEIIDAANGVGQSVKKKDDTLYLDCISTTSFELSTNYPKIFSGFSKQEIEEIAEKLYGWQDDLPSYKAWKRSLKDARNNDQW